MSYPINGHCKIAHVPEPMRSPATKHQDCPLIPFPGSQKRALHAGIVSNDNTILQPDSTLSRREIMVDRHDNIGEKMVSESACDRATYI